RESMAKKCTKARKKAIVLAQGGCQKNGNRAFQGIEQQGEGGELAVAGAQYVGRADIAGANLAHIAESGEAGEDKPERNGADEIAAKQCSHHKRQPSSPAHGFNHSEIPPQDECTLDPATIVCKTRPCIRASSNVVFLERERISFLRTSQGWSRSTNMRSAGEPGFSVPPGRPKILAGLVESTSTRRDRVTSPE